MATNDDVFNLLKAVNAVTLSTGKRIECSKCSYACSYGGRNYSDKSKGWRLVY